MHVMNTVITLCRTLSYSLLRIASAMVMSGMIAKVNWITVSQSILEVKAL